MSIEEDLKLRVQQELFCKEYMTDFNGKQAAIRAGYSKTTATSQASRLLTYDNVQHRIQELAEQRMAVSTLSIESVLTEMKKIAYADPKDAYNDDGSLKAIKDIPKHLRQSISAIQTDELWEGKGKDREQVGITRTIKFWSKDKQLEQLGKYLKMFVDVKEHTVDQKLEDLITASYGDKKNDTPSK